MAFCSATQQSMWFRSILAEIGLPRQEPTIIYEDNSGAIELVSNSVISKRLKHVDIRLCFVDAIEKKIVSTRCSTVKECRTCAGAVRSGKD